MIKPDALLNPRYLLLVVLALLTSTGAYRWWMGSYAPRNAAISALAAHEEHLNQSNQRARSTIANLGLDRIESALVAYDQQAQHVARLVPQNAEQEPLMPKLTGAARAYGVHIEQLTPLPRMVVNGFQADGFSVTATGAYHDVGAFLTALLSQRRITQVRDVKLAAFQTAPPQFPRPTGSTIETSPTATGWAVRVSFRYLAFSGDGNAQVGTPSTAPGTAKSGAPTATPEARRPASSAPKRPHRAPIIVEDAS